MTIAGYLMRWGGRSKEISIKALGSTKHNLNIKFKGHHKPPAPHYINYEPSLKSGKYITWQIYATIFY